MEETISFYSSILYTYLYKVPLAVKTNQRHPSVICPRKKKRFKNGSSRGRGARKNL